MSASDIITAKKLAAYKYKGATGCGSPYGKLLDIRQAQLSATYTATGVTLASGGAGYYRFQYLTLLDNGNPPAIVQIGATGGAGTITSVSLTNSPVYMTPPSTSTIYQSTGATGTGATFKLQNIVGSNCYACTNNS